MGYEVRIAPTAQRQYHKLPAVPRQRVGKALAALSEEPRPSGVVELRGSSTGGSSPGSTGLALSSLH